MHPNLEFVRKALTDIVNRLGRKGGISPIPSVSEYQNLRQALGVLERYEEFCKSPKVLNDAAMDAIASIVAPMATKDQHSEVSAAKEEGAYEALSYAIQHNYLAPAPVNEFMLISGDDMATFIADVISDNDLNISREFRERGASLYDKWKSQKVT